MKFGFVPATLAAVLVLGGCGYGTAVGGQERTRRCADVAGATHAPRCTRDTAAKQVTDRKRAKKCVDVTSQDHNWDNDMLCTRPNGTKFYTDYEGADAYLSR